MCLYKCFTWGQCTWTSWPLHSLSPRGYRALCSPRPLQASAGRLLKEQMKVRSRLWLQIDAIWLLKVSPRMLEGPGFLPSMSFIPSTYRAATSCRSSSPPFPGGGGGRRLVQTVHINVYKDAPDLLTSLRVCLFTVKGQVEFLPSPFPRVPSCDWAANQGEAGN